jgi:hypothetical protein
MRYRLRTLVILTSLGPPVVAAVLMLAGGVPFHTGVVAVAAYVGLVATLIVVSKVAESREIQSPAASDNPYFESQVETFDRQTREQDRLLAEQEQSMQRAADLRLSKRLTRDECNCCSIRSRSKSGART